VCGATAGGVSCGVTTEYPFGAAAHESRSYGVRMPISTVAPRILLANPDEIFARSLESILSSAGYAVLWAPTALSALAQEQRERPDAAIIAMELADEGGGLALCRALRQKRGLSPSMPIFLTQSSAATRPQRIEALRAGADELWGQPMDPEEFGLRLAAQLRAKSGADRAREEGLLDDRSRFWNDRGLLRRAEELLAATIRDRAAIGVAVVDIEGDGRKNDLAIGDRVAEGLRRWARLSDAVGRIGNTRFGVVAPRTGRRGCARLGERLLNGIDLTFGEACSWLRVGFVAFDDASAAPAAAELVGCAALAAREGAPSANDVRVRCWPG
jgi:DNA-binding response OmpR family regulator